MPEPIQHPMPLVNGAAEFEVAPGASGQAWHGSNGRIGVTVFPSEDNTDPSKRLGQVPALVFKGNHIHRAGTPLAYREQLCIGELNGVFVHVQDKGGMVHVTVADHRLD